MLPVPLAAPQLEPAGAAHVQLALVIAAGSVSATGASVTALGPALLTTIVYVVLVPGTYVVAPSVLVIARSACGAAVSVSVALLLPGVGSVTPAGAATVAVLTRS